MRKLICNRYIKMTGLAIAAMLSNPVFTLAQDASGQVGDFSEGELLMGLAIFLAVSLIFAVVGLLFAVLSVKGLLNPKPAEERSIAEQEIQKEESFWKKLQLKLTDAVPVEREAEVMTDHEYDGIRELDNRLPPWWVYMFYATIVFSVIYLAAFHLFGWGQLQEEEYQAEITEAKLEIEAYMAAKGGALNEDNVTMVTEESLLADGKAIYEMNCAPCHGMELQGTVGPNLTDAYWIHGGSIGDVFKTIRDGVPSKGMISWKSQLSPEQIQNLSSYIISMEGSNPPNAKEPQGELFER